jgi:hypothetical protein
MIQTMKVPLGAIALGLMLGACTQARTDVSFQTPQRPRGLTCDVATATVTTFGRATAQLYAGVALKHQISELQGYLFNAGLRRIRVTQRATSCHAFDKAGTSSGLFDCTARAQMCGR